MPTTQTKTYTTYKYNELLQCAKEKVKYWYLQGQEPQFFQESVEETCADLYNQTELKVQFSLSSCQGDGLNLYGDFDLIVALDYEEIKNQFTEKELKALKFYIEESVGTSVKAKCNDRYCYHLDNFIEFAEDMIDDLEYQNSYKNINKDLIFKFEKAIQKLLSKWCSEFEKNGYDYFYEISEEDLNELCECNEYEFLEDGSVF